MDILLQATVCASYLISHKRTICKFNTDSKTIIQLRHLWIWRPGLDAADPNLQSWGSEPHSQPGRNQIKQRIFKLGDRHKLIGKWVCAQFSANHQNTSATAVGAAFGWMQKCGCSMSAGHVFELWNGKQTLVCIAEEHDCRKMSGRWLREMVVTVRWELRNLAYCDFVFLGQTLSAHKWPRYVKSGKTSSLKRPLWAKC